MTTTANYTYKISAKSGVVSCAPYTSYFGLFRDEYHTETSKEAKEDKWETFTEDSLESYFTNGLAAFTAKLEDLKDTKKPYTREDALQMTFMLESLIYARQLLAES